MEQHGTTWNNINDNRIFIVRWTIPFKSWILTKHYSTNLVVIGHKTVLAHVDTMFKAEQVRNLPLGTLAQTHDIPVKKKKKPSIYKFIQNP